MASEIDQKTSFSKKNVAHTIRARRRIASRSRKAAVVSRKSSAMARAMKRKKAAAAAELRRQRWRPEKREPGIVRRGRPRPDWTVAKVQQALIDGCLMLRSRAISGLKRWTLPDGIITQIEAMFGYPGTQPNALASNMTTRLAVGRRWVIEAVGMQRRHPEWSFFMVTIFDDRIRTSERETRIDLSAFVKNIRNLLNYAGIKDWLGTIEFQAYNNGKRGLGGDLSPHGHILFWLPFGMTKQMRQRLEGTRRFSSLSGAPTVMVTERANTSGQIAHWASYIFKAPERAANVRTLQSKQGVGDSRDAFLRPIYAIRLMEVLSQMTLDQLIIAGGDGRTYRKRIDEIIRRRSVYSRSWPLRPEDARNVWAVARVIAKKTNRTPVRFGAS